MSEEPTVELDPRAREQAASKEITEVLGKYHCKIVGEMLVTETGCKSLVKVIAV